MPKADDLPDALKELAFRHCLAVRADPDFHTDVERLVRGIHDTLGKVAPAADSAWDITKSGHAVWVSEKARNYLRENVLKEKSPDPLRSPRGSPGAGAGRGQSRRRAWSWWSPRSSSPSWPMGASRIKPIRWSRLRAFASAARS